MLLTLQLTLLTLLMMMSLCDCCKVVVVVDDGANLPFLAVAVAVAFVSVLIQ